MACGIVGCTVKLREHPRWAEASAEVIASAGNDPAWSCTVARSVERVGRLPIRRAFRWFMGPEVPYRPRGPWLTANVVDQLAIERQAYDLAGRLFHRRRPSWRTTLARLEQDAMVSCDGDLALSVLYNRDDDSRSLNHTANCRLDALGYVIERAGRIRDVLNAETESSARTISGLATELRACIGLALDVANDLERHARRAAKAGA